MTTVEVLVDGAEGPVLVGQAHFTRQRGQVSTTFLNDPSYLIADDARHGPASPNAA